ncbi:MAG: DUF1810 domain-containing protein [Synergistaceae bacterium]|nr:DUF1810 domain-containing protein [Synergistaceae bacterium]
MKTYDLERFVKAQRYDYPVALSEMIAGHKKTHWIWYIFPQLKELGRSSRAKDYGIEDIDEARQYLNHPILGARLKEITGEILKHEGISVDWLMGSGIDVMKLRSSMTLFAYISEEGSVFHKAIDKYFGGKMDEETISLLKK